MKTLSNSQLTIQVAPLGAELSSITANATGKEYLWQADPAFWKRHSPVLFPIVGGVWDNEYRHNGITYPLSQHLWSPPSKNAPFICIEPWYGRCDRVNYTGEYKDKDWMQQIQPDEIFNASYLIEIHHL